LPKSGAASDAAPVRIDPHRARRPKKNRTPKQETALECSLMGDTGLEPGHASCSRSNGLYRSSFQAGAESDATMRGTDLASIRMKTVTDIWPRLPEPIQRSILALVEAFDV
ncbi:MAG: hypothetical protein AAF593_13460, partial [Planctomycetota bacterium]